jgi:hypothetical protein
VSDLANLHPAYQLSILQGGVVSVSRSRLCGLIAMALSSLAFMSAPASAATKGGMVHIWSSGSGVTTPILLTGAIADYGNGTSQDKNGKVDINGLYEKAVLKKGSFLIDSHGLAAAFGHAQQSFDATTCSGSISVTGPTSIVPGSGTGAYKGMKGTITVTLTIAAISPRLASGKCNQSDNAQSVSQYSTVTGSGAISFS